MTRNGPKCSTTVPATDSVPTVSVRSNSDELVNHQIAVKLVAGFILVTLSKHCYVIYCCCHVSCSFIWPYYGKDDVGQMTIFTPPAVGMRAVAAATCYYIFGDGRARALAF